MAIINENNGYYKIISSITDYINQRTIINFEVYENREARIIEKELLSDVHTFLNKAHIYVTQLRKNFEDAINQIISITEVENEEEVLNQYPQLKEHYDLVLSSEYEYYNLSTKLFKEIIDISEIQHYDIWKELGLVDTWLDIKIIKMQRASGIPGISNNNLSDLYTDYKKNYSGFTDDLE